MPKKIFDVDFNFRKSMNNVACLISNDWKSKTPWHVAGTTTEETHKYIDSHTSYRVTHNREIDELTDIGMHLLQSSVIKRLYIGPIAFRLISMRQEIVDDEDGEVPPNAS